MDILAFGRDPQNQSKISDQIYRFFLSKSNKYLFAVPEAQNQSNSDQICWSFDPNRMHVLLHLQYQKHKVLVVRLIDSLLIQIE